MQTGAENARLNLLLGAAWFHRLCEDYHLPQIDFTEKNIHVPLDAAGKPLDDIRTPEDNSLVADFITERLRLLPFVRLREGLHPRLKEGQASFSKAIAMANRTQAVPKLTLDIAANKVWMDDESIELSPIEFCIYYWLVNRLLQGTPLTAWSENSMGEEFLQFATKLDVNIGGIERSILMSLKANDGSFPMEFSWHQVSVRLVAQRPMGMGTPLLVVLNAFLKSIKPQLDAQACVRQAFRVPGEYAHRLRCCKGRAIELEVDFFGADSVWLDAWQAALQRHVLQNRNSGFALARPPQVMPMSFRWEPASGEVTHAELEFLSPLPFKREKGGSRTALQLQPFLEQLQRRVEQLLGQRLELPPLDGIRMQSNHWHYTELHHRSKSQPGHTQYFNGCFGSLYFSGDLAGILPWLKLAAALHAGGPVELNPLGHCRLHIPTRSGVRDGQRWRRKDSR